MPIYLWCIKPEIFIDTKIKTDFRSKENKTLLGMFFGKHWNKAHDDKD